MQKPKRFIVGKMGLDSHDNGVRIVAKWLMDCGYEVIYAGLFNTSEKIVQMAMEEDADAIGASFLGGEHMYYARELIDRLREKKMGRVKVIFGGVIPPDDVEELDALGVEAVFTPGTPKGAILDRIKSLVS